MASSPYEECHHLSFAPGQIKNGDRVEAVQNLLTNPYDIEAVLGPARGVISDTIEALEQSTALATSAEQRAYVRQEIPRIKPTDQLMRDIVSLHEQSTGGLGIDEFTEDIFKRYDLHAAFDAPETATELKDISSRTKLHGERVTDAIERIIEADETGVSAYVAAKLLAAHPGVIVHNLDAVIAQDCVVIGAESESSDLYGLLAYRAESGKFDSHIAKDLLLQASMSSGDESLQEKKMDSPLCKMVDMAGQLLATGDRQEIIALLAREDILQTWLKEPRLMLEAARKDLVDSLNQRFMHRRESAYAHGLLIRQATLTDIERFVAKSRASAPSSIRGKVANRPSTKRRHRSGRAKPVGRTAVNSVKQESESAPVRKLHHINTRGEVSDDQSEEFHKMLTDYLGAHPNDASKLKVTLSKALDYLRDPILTNGFARGIGPYKNGFIAFPDDNTRYKVYRFRPNQATGVPMSCEIAQKMRILFVIDKNDGKNIHIMSVCDRDEVADHYARYGGTNVVKN